MIDLAQKYNTLVEHKEHIGYDQARGLGWYAIASYAVEDADVNDEPIADINAYMAQYVGPERMAFILYTDDATDYAFGEPGTMFSCVPLTDDGEYPEHIMDDGISSRFDWVVECSNVFDDLPFKIENLAESWELGHADLETLRTYFESKGFKVTTGVWD